MTKPSYPATLAATSLTAGIVACWPLNEGAGTTAADIVGGGVLACGGAGVSWSASPVGLLTVGSPSSATLATPGYLKLQPPLTLLWVGQVLGTVAQLGGFGGVAEVAASLNDYVICPYGGDVAYSYNVAGSGTGTVSGVAVAPGEFNLVMRLGNPQDGGESGAWMTGWSGGNNETNSLTPIASIGYGGTSQVFLGTFPGSTATTDVRHDLLVAWDRLLLASEIAALAADPYQILAAPSAGATGAALLMM